MLSHQLGDVVAGKRCREGLSLGLVGCFGRRNLETGVTPVGLDADDSAFIPHFGEGVVYRIGQGVGWVNVFEAKLGANLSD